MHGKKGHLIGQNFLFHNIDQFGSPLTRLIHLRFKSEKSGGDSDDEEKYQQHSPHVVSYILRVSLL